MKITDTVEKAKVPFCDIQHGDAFKYGDVYYLKMVLIGGNNAVRLTNGWVAQFDGKTNVIKLNAEIVITN